MKENSTESKEKTEFEDSAELKDPLNLEESILNIIKTSKPREGIPTFVLLNSVGSPKTVRTIANLLGRRGFISKDSLAGVNLYIPNFHHMSDVKITEYLKTLNSRRAKKVQIFLSILEKNKARKYPSVTRAEIIRKLKLKEPIISSDGIHDKIDDLIFRGIIEEEFFGPARLLRFKK